MPVEVRMGADLMLVHCSGFGEEFVTGLHAILEHLLSIGFDAEERLCRPERGLVFVSNRIGFWIRLAILCPHPVLGGVVIEMTVLMIVYVTSINPEIEIACAERMREIHSHYCLAQRSQAPFSMMMRIDIQNRVLAVVHMVAEIEERIRMTQGRTDIPMERLERLETRRLREEWIDTCFRCYLLAGSIVVSTTAGLVAILPAD